MSSKKEYHIKEKEDDTDWTMNIQFFSGNGEITISWSISGTNFESWPCVIISPASPTSEFSNTNANKATINSESLYSQVEQKAIFLSF